MADLRELQAIIDRYRSENPDPGVYGDSVVGDPNNVYPAIRQDMPPRDIQRVGNPSDTGFDYTVDWQPVYLTPQGDEYIGPLEFAPSIPQDSKPIRWVPVPITPERVA